MSYKKWRNQEINDRLMESWGFNAPETKILKELSTIRRQGGKIEYLRPDSKSQVTVEYDRNGIPVSIDTILVSTQHDSFAKDDREMVDKIKKDILEILLPRVFDNENQNIS